MEVFPLPIPTDSPLDGHDVALYCLSHGVRDSVNAVTHDVCQRLPDYLRNSDQRLEFLILPGFQWQGSRGLRLSLPQKNRIRVL